MKRGTTPWRRGGLDHKEKHMTITVNQLIFRVATEQELVALLARLQGLPGVRA